MLLKCALKSLYEARYHYYNIIGDTIALELREFINFFSHFFNHLNSPLEHVAIFQI